MSIVGLSPVDRLFVIGGGLAGLSTAYYLSQGLKHDPRKKIILIERENRFGGWISSTDAAASSSSSSSLTNLSQTCIFESGPRSVRPVGLAGLLTLDLVNELGLSKSLIFVHKTHPSAKNRYIYSKNGLVRLPTTIKELILSIHKEPIRHIPIGIIRDLTGLNDCHQRTFKKEDEPIEDESIKSFIDRRFGGKLGEELISGMVHGIYAGDYSKLSVRSTIFGKIWKKQQRYGKGLIRGLLKDQERIITEEEKEEEEQIKSLKQKLNSSLMIDLDQISVWSLKGGLETLIKKLKEWCSKQDNIEIKTNEEVLKIEYQKELEEQDNDRENKKKNDRIITKFKIHTNLRTYDDHVNYLISAIPPLNLNSCLSESMKFELGDLLSYNSSVTVAVVNLGIRIRNNHNNTDNHHHHHHHHHLNNKNYNDNQRWLSSIPKGFGYLIPQNINKELNPHYGLGVVFDSDMMSELDDHQNDYDLIKLTIMLGGHYYDNLNLNDYCQEEILKQAIETIQLQLKLNIQIPNNNNNNQNQNLKKFELVYSNVNIQKNCIPQYLINHHLRMKHLRLKLLTRYDGNLILIGNGYNGIGLNDVILNSRNVCDGLINGDGFNKVTGLEVFA